MKTFLLVPMKESLPVFTDETLVAMMKGSMKQRDQAILYVLKKWKYEIVAVLNQKGASKLEIEYTLEDAIVTFDKQIREGKFRHESSLKTYFIGICKRVFMNRRWDKLETTDLPIEAIPTGATTEETTLTRLYRREVSTFVQKILAALTLRCRDLLTLYMLSFTNREIKEQMDIPSENAVGNALFECRQKFRQLCEKSPLFKKIIHELLGNE